MTPPLSPAAQAVLDAVLDETAPLSEQHQTRADAAAALRAAVNQIDLLPLDAVALTIEDMIEQRIRHKLLAIATELEAQ